MSNITLLDFFAGCALIASDQAVYQQYDKRATSAFSMAEAMLKESKTRSRDGEWADVDKL
jgi:hypothetical protein